MSELPEYWTCPHCRTQQDIAEVGFFAEIACPQCGSHAHVHNMLANYKVESVLGIGGMSVVFMARDLVLGRPLAIKVLNDTYRDAPERIAGFENECSLMAKVRHENVVSVYSAGWARGQFFIAMELVDGRNLELIVADEGRLEPLQAIEIIRQVALGLQAANEAGILHRDVKPGNVLISADGKAKVLDFGLSLEEKDGVDEDEIIWATPYYVPPETLRREDETVRTDIYALGMTLRNLLTGEAVLPGSPQHVADMLVAKRTLPRLQETAPELDSSLCKLVDALTAFEPADRPADYAEVLQMVEKVQKNLQEEADPAARTRRQMRKLYVAAGAAASVALGVVGAFLVAMQTPSGQVQETLPVGALQWAELGLYKDGSAALLAGDKRRASELLGQLTAADADPVVTAAAILLRTSIDVLEGKSSANGYKRFAEFAQQAEHISPMGRPVFERLASFMTALQKEIMKAEQLADGLENPLLRSAALVLVADYYVHAGAFPQAEQFIARAKEALSADTAAALRAHVAEYEVAAPRRSSRMWHAAVKELYRNGEYAEAADRIKSMQSKKLSRAEKEEINVMQEASVVMGSLLELMKKKGKSAYSGMNPGDLLTSARGMRLYKTLPEEIYCVALLLSGEYETAFRENPYVADEASQAPFAVMMRDWKTRLGL